MNRLRRILLWPMHLIAVLCLLLSVASLVMWPISHARPGEFIHHTDRHPSVEDDSLGLHVYWFDGWLSVDHNTFPPTLFSTSFDESHINGIGSIRIAHSPHVFKDLDFVAMSDDLNTPESLIHGYYAAEGIGERPTFQLCMPAWLWAAAWFIPSWLWLFWMAFRLRRYRRRKQQRCVRCAYSLRGLRPDTTACPECGRAIPQAIPQSIKDKLKATDPTRSSPRSPQPG